MDRNRDLPLPRGATIGIMGGGQLGRMLAMAAARLGFRTHIYAPPGDNPAFAVAHAHTEAGFDDEAALKAFAEACDVVTYEWENVPVKACDLIGGLCPVRPKPDVLRVSQDRVAEKTYISGLRIPVPDFHPAASVEELEQAVSHIGRPAVLKTRRFGYDGKGQARIKDATDLAAAFADIGGQPAILEAFVPFEREVSVIAARDVHGTIACFDVAENIHENGILRSSTVPARLKPRTATQARHIAATLLDALDYVGVIGVEMFLSVKGGEESLMVNEIAPRVHNSGHWTEAACHVSQFEQHIRAITGWPLGDTRRHSDCVMENLLGEEIEVTRNLTAIPGTVVHDYGKAEVRPGRKMGHVTRLKLRK
ncbi:MAG: 5-(carboxyamino)imidazole ribonucleotide synthase [Anderseniella sp.]|jgi:5-(carboxyamino)imidazole ribonucleotide synthase|nr:5-(carboxyamino)imidazole ribonucleotide synthase [Anderseniella sp.]